MSDTPLKILIIDDDMSVRKLYSHHLSRLKQPHKIIEAKSGREGINLYFSESPDCVLLDYILGDTNGIEVLKSFTEYEEAVPVILITGYGSEAISAKAFKYGAQDYLAKETVTPESLVHAVEKVIQHIQMAERISEQDIAIENFAKIITHDLRDPLNALEGKLTLLMMHNEKTLDDKSRGYLQRAMECCEQMDAMIQDLYSYCMIEEDRHATTTFSSYELVKQTLSELDSLIQERGVIVESDQNLPMVAGNAVLLTQVFYHLIDNAIKYNESLPASVKISVIDKEDFWIFCVKNNGVGIDPKHHKRIFDKFQRVTNDPNITGSGLGLAICSKVVAMHGGKFWVESKLGEGATFAFSLSKKTHIQKENVSE